MNEVRIINQFDYELLKQYARPGFIYSTEDNHRLSDSEKLDKILDILCNRVY